VSFYVIIYLDLSPKKRVCPKRNPKKLPQKWMAGLSKDVKKLQKPKERWLLEALFPMKI